MSYDPFDFEREDEIPDGYIAVEEAFRHVVENDWGGVLEAVTEEKNQEWLKRYKPYLDLLTIASRHDRDQLQNFIRLGSSWNSSPRLTLSETVSDTVLFAVAAQVCNFVEDLANSHPGRDPKLNPVLGGLWLSREPDPVSHLIGCRASCSLEGDLEWARELIVAVRMFRNLLFVIGDPSDPLFHSEALGTVLRWLDEAFRRDSNPRLAYWYDSHKEIRFSRVPATEDEPITPLIVRWFRNYLVDIYPTLPLAACVECGAFFHKSRKDNVYCTKTCQNRVAYKRKKILETDALCEVAVDPESTAEIVPGLVFHHGRLGLGVVETVEYGRDETPITRGRSAKEFLKESILSFHRARSIRMRVFFPHGARIFNYEMIFGSGKEEIRHKFYSVANREIVASLL